MIRYVLPLFIFSSIVALSGCGEGGRSNGTGIPSISCTADKFTVINTTDLANGMNMVSGCYRIQTVLNIRSGALIIAPNTWLEFAPGTSITISDNGSLLANGTPDQPILFTGQKKEKGSWDGIVFHHSLSTANSIKYATIEYAGGNAFSSPPLAASVIFTGTTETHPIGTSPMNLGNIVFTNNTIQKSGAYGVYVGKSSALRLLTGNRFIDTDKNPLMIYASDIGLLDRSNSFSQANNLPSQIYIVGSDIGQLNLPAPTKTVFPYFPNTEYFISRPIPFSKNVLFPGIVSYVPTEIEAGVRFRFDEDTAFMISSSQAYLRAVGTPNQKIVFTGERNKQPTQGAWKGIIFSDTDNSRNEIDNVSIEYGGATYLNGIPGANITVVTTSNTTVSQLKLRNALISSSSGYGVYVRYPSKLSEFKSNSITQNALAPITTTVDNIQALDTTNNLTGNLGNDFVYIENDRINESESVTIPKLSVPYRFKGDLSVYGSLTIRAGATLQFSPQKSLQVIGSSSQIMAQGTSFDKITFTSASVPPSPGSWRGIRVHNSTNASNILENSRVEYGGSSDAAPSGNIVVSATASGVTGNNSILTLNNVESYNSGSWGLWKDPSATVNITGSAVIYSNNVFGNQNP